MKLQTALKTMTLVVILAASTLAGFGGSAAKHTATCPASAPTITEMKPEVRELAMAGYQVGQAQA